MSALVPLNLPRFDIRVRHDDDSRRGGLEVFDPLRGKWVALTPEEWVRQHFVNFLITQRDFPQMLMANEVSLTFNSMPRRVDTMVYTRALNPLCVVEYKAPDVVLTQKVFDQIARYNSVIEAPCLIVSNGIHHYCCRYTAQGYTFLPDIPNYRELLY